MDGLPPFFSTSTQCDPAYGNVRDKTELREYKCYVEFLWRAYAPYADKHFLSDAVTHFQERFWEMYLGVSFLANGHCIDRGGNEGPEFFVLTTNRKVWFEAIAPSAGEGVDAVPQPNYGAIEAQRAPVDEVILRLRHAIEEKKKKYVSYVEKGIVASNDIYIIGINSKRIRTIIPEPELPCIVKSVYPFGNLAVAIDKNTLQIVDSRHEHRDKIQKKKGGNISTSIFLDAEYAGISAVLYSSVDCANKPRTFGGDFVLVHNSVASNQLDVGTFQFGKEYWIEDDELKFTQWS